MGKSVESMSRCCLRLLSIAFCDKYACGLPIENGVPLLSFSVSRYYRYLCPVPPAIADEQHMTNNESSIIVALFFIWF